MESVTAATQGYAQVGNDKHMRWPEGRIGVSSSVAQRSSFTFVIVSGVTRNVAKHVYPGLSAAALRVPR